MAEKKTAAFFDLDKTIIAKSSTLAFSKPFFNGGLITRRSVLRSAYAQFVFALSGADENQMEKMREYLTELVKGWDVEVVRQAVSETLNEIIDPLVYQEAVQLIDHHRSRGRDIVIISASGSEVVEPIGHLLGADHTIATRLVEVDGKYTGEIEFYAYAANKAAAIHEMADQYGYDLTESFAYSDSVTDLPMLETVGHAFAVNPDKALRKIASERGWQILQFAKPVELRSRVLQSPTQKAFAASMVTAALFGIAIMVWASKRSKRSLSV